MTELMIKIYSTVQSWLAIELFIDGEIHRIPRGNRKKLILELLKHIRLRFSNYIINEVYDTPDIIFTLDSEDENTETIIKTIKLLLKSNIRIRKNDIEKYFNVIESADFNGLYDMLLTKSIADSL